MGSASPDEWAAAPLPAAPLKGAYLLSGGGTAVGLMQDPSGTWVAVQRDKKEYPHTMRHGEDARVTDSVGVNVHDG